VRAVGHCGECHTPRSALTMAVDGSRLLAGNSKRTGPEGQMAPNITPDRATGVGEWSEEQIAAYLATGNQPDGDVAGGLMGGNIQGTLAGYKDLTPADLREIARYLKSIPAIRDEVDERRGIHFETLTDRGALPTLSACSRACAPRRSPGSRPPPSSSRWT